MVKPSFIFLLIAATDHCSAAKDTCYADNLHPNLSFGPKTDYHVVNDGKGIVNVPDCETVQLWMVIRPGASWPSDNVFQRLLTLPQLRDKIIANHQAGRGELCEKDLEKLKASQFPTEGAEEEHMTEQGEKDMQELANTLKIAFPDIFKKPYSQEDRANYEFRYMATANSKQSVEKFAKTVFGPDFDVSKIHAPAEIDGLLNVLPHLMTRSDRRSQNVVQVPTTSLTMANAHKNPAPELCEAWREKIHGEFWETFSSREIDLRTITSLREEVSRRLGFQKTLDKEFVILMYLGCALQKAMNPADTSAWCAVFTDDNIKLLEFMEDCFYYKACGPEDKNDMTFLKKKLLCPLYKDLFAQFSRPEKNRFATAGRFYFTDEMTLLLLLNGLGFLTDSSISDFASMDQRTFKTSSLAPFGGNFLAAFYKCSSGEEFQVGFYLNGLPLNIPGRSQNIQPWKEFKSMLNKDFISNLQCSADMCTVKSNIMQVYDFFPLLFGG